MANIAPTPTAPQAPADWIDYREAEAALFREIRPELKLIAFDHAQHFGADVADMADEVAEALYPKAVAVLQEQGTLRAFGDKHLFAKCQKWAAYWCKHYAERERRKAARRRNAEDRQAYQRQRGARGLQTQRRRMDSRALQCQILKFQGLTARQIAAAVGCSVRTVKSDYKRPVDAGLFAEALRPVGGVQSAKERPVPENQVSTDTRKSVADCTPSPQIAPEPPEPPPPRPPSEIDRIGELIPDLLRAHWAT